MSHFGEAIPRSSDSTAASDIILFAEDLEADDLERVRERYTKYIRDWEQVNDGFVSHEILAEIKELLGVV